ncbi:50S ribosomal protein L23 [Candidatus Kuenenbacteria bacterium CG1_02_38_13]|uniref:Large ribosomal subunit protein uL23 n=1 Tax=Candidatus Kuenenbacteria bacterium CG1_02_38_13 TaxID=1805235 RepID=A0A1J4U141_9BACT|nr:MAG: 50S ribosomal protein L23 [Candidatus Kuenenbacteria bacterium CG1_02_38_13]
MLVRPLITEKAGALGVFNQYVFEVSGKANKVEVKKSVEQIYGVRPMSVNMSNVLGKGVRFGRRISQCKSWRKAIVTLREGDKIEVYEGV